MNERLDAEEREILDAFERNQLRSQPDAKEEIEHAKGAARNTFNKTKRVNLRVTERDFEAAHLKSPGRRHSLPDVAIQCHSQIPEWSSHREALTTQQALEFLHL